MAEHFEYQGNGSQSDDDDQGSRTKRTNGGPTGFSPDKTKGAKYAAGHSTPMGTRTPASSAHDDDVDNDAMEVVINNLPDAEGYVFEGEVPELDDLELMTPHELRAAEDAKIARSQQTFESDGTATSAANSAKEMGLQQPTIFFSMGANKPARLAPAFSALSPGSEFQAASSLSALSLNHGRASSSSSSSTLPAPVARSLATQLAAVGNKTLDEEFLSILNGAFGAKATEEILRLAIAMNPKLPEPYVTWVYQKTLTKVSSPTDQWIIVLTVCDEAKSTVDVHKLLISRLAAIFPHTDVSGVIRVDLATGNPNAEFIPLWTTVIRVQVPPNIHEFLMDPAKPLVGFFRFPVNFDTKFEMDVKLDAASPMVTTLVDTDFRALQDQILSFHDLCGRHGIPPYLLCALARPPAVKAGYVAMFALAGEQIFGLTERVGRAGLTHGGVHMIRPISTANLPRAATHMTITPYFKMKYTFDESHLLSNRTDPEKLIKVREDVNAHFAGKVIAHFPCIFDFPTKFPPRAFGKGQVYILSFRVADEAASNELAEYLGRNLSKVLEEYLYIKKAN